MMMVVVLMMTMTMKIMLQVYGARSASDSIEIPLHLQPA